MSEHDASLLFGVFAVQFKKITPQQLHEVAAQWQKEPSRELSQMLVESGFLTEDDYNRIRGLVEDARRAHDGDSSAALETFGGKRMLDETYRDAITLGQDQIRTVPMPEGAIPGVPLDNIDAVDETPGRYTNQSEYARGGIGRVLLVHDQHLGREIAMKELLPFTDYVDESMKLEKSPVRQSMALITRFLQEARVTGQLEHPSIVPVYELGRRRDGTLYYTMKLVRGRTLASAIREAATMPNRLALLSHFVDLCQAIAYSHSRRVIHRDIKPSNVMVGKFGETVVLDWGLAKVKDKKDDAASQIEETLKTLRLPAAKGHETHAGQVLGTPAYMPPEQAAGQIERVDERSDVYSLGAVLYTLLTGKYPYGGDNASEILNRLLVGPPKPVLEVEPTAPPELAAICERAMQREADKRYKNAKELADDVVRFQTGALVVAHSYKFSDHLARFVQRHKPALATASLFTVALAAFAVYSYVRVTHERNDAIAARDSEAEQRQRADELRVAETEQRKTAEGLLYQSNIRLAQSQIESKRFDLAMAALDAAPQEFRGWEWDYLNGLCHQDLWTFDPKAGYVNKIAVSRDGAIVAVGLVNGTAYIIDAKTGSLRATLQGHSQSIEFIDINPSSTQVITGSVDGTVVIWDSNSGALLLTLQAHTDILTHCEFSKDGLFAVTSSYDGETRIWNPGDGALKQTLRCDGSQVYETAISADGRRMAAGSAIGTVKIWDPNTGQEVAAAKIDHSVGKLCFNPAATSLIIGCQDGAIFVWNMDPGTSPTPLSSHASWINSIAYSADGSFLVTGSRDTVRVWNTGDNSLLHSLDIHDDAVYALAPIIGGSTFISASADHIVRLVDSTTGKVKRDFLGHSGAVMDCQLFSDGGRFVTCSLDGTVKAWATEQASATIVLRGDGNPFAEITFDPSGTRVLTRSEWGDSSVPGPNCRVDVWNAQTGSPIQTVAERSSINNAIWSPDGVYILMASDNKTATIFDANTGMKIRRLTGHTGSVKSAIFSPDGALVLTLSHDKTAILWHVSDGEIVRTLVGHTAGIDGGTFSPDGSRIATYGSDKFVRIWDTATGSMLHALTGHTVRISAALFLNDNIHLVTAAGDNIAILWDTVAGKEIRRFQGHTNAIWHAALSPDNKLLATASEDATIRIWDIGSAKELSICKGHSGSVWNVAFSPDGKRMVSAGGDGTVRVWDSATGRELLTFREHTGIVTSVEFGPDGKAVASASEDGTCMVRRIN